jgi:hypothetical protein
MSKKCGCTVIEFPRQDSLVLHWSSASASSPSVLDEIQRICADDWLWVYSAPVLTSLNNGVISSEERRGRRVWIEVGTRCSRQNMYLRPRWLFAAA